MTIGFAAKNLIDQKPRFTFVQVSASVSTLHLNRPQNKICIVLSIILVYFITMYT